MSESVKEKIKQKAKLMKDDNLPSCWGQFVLLNEVLEILEDREQTLRELADLLKNRPQWNPYSSETDKRQFVSRILDWAEESEKKFAELGLDTKKEKDI